MLSQAILESAWGTSYLATHGNNLLASKRMLHGRVIQLKSLPMNTVMVRRSKKSTCLENIIHGMKV